MRSGGRRIQSFMAPLDAPQHRFSVAHAAHLVDVAKEWHLSGEDVLGGTDLTRQAIYEPTGTLSVSQVTTMLARARHLTGEPALGVHIGLRTRPTLYGLVGFALMSASSIHEAIEISLEYGRLVTTALTMRFRVERGTAAIIIDEHADFGEERDTVMLASLIALWQVSRSLTGRELTTTTAEFALPEPEYRSRINVPGLRMRFNRPSHRLTFDARSLDLPYIMPDRVALRIALEQCRQKVDSLGLDAGLSARVRGLLARPEGGFRSLEEVAEALKRSPRTLKRHLAAQGMRFSALRDAELCERAMVLLRYPDVSVAETASQLGYSKVTNFERAFHRWTTLTPAKWRRANADRREILESA